MTSYVQDLKKLVRKVPRCSNCSNCEFVVDRFEHGEIIGSYNSCKKDNSVITDEEQITNCLDWKRKKIEKFIFEVRKESLKCPF